MYILIGEKEIIRMYEDEGRTLSAIAKTVQTVNKIPLKDAKRKVEKTILNHYRKGSHTNEIEENWNNWNYR